MMKSISAFLVAGMVALVGIGCDSDSVYRSSCDPNVEQCFCDEQVKCPSGFACEEGVCGAFKDGGVDSAVNEDFGFLPDTKEPDQAIEKKKFGEGCNDKAECETGICVFAGIGGVCSELCTAGTCPEGYGCLGVRDVIEQGTVSDVCVPNANQLCSPCEKDKECALHGNDICLEFPGGTRYCGRDCSTIDCPTGYTCEEVTDAGQKYKQCMPVTGGCDCDTSKKGTTQSCPLTTPFGECDGTRECLGDVGWGACTPPSTDDVPDGSYGDENCDGIDGVYEAGIFVAESGADDVTCGLTHDKPCLTISYGIKRAGAVVGRDYVYVQAGEYEEVVELANGVHVFGGYDSNWKRGPRSQSVHRVTIKGKLHAGDDQYITLRAYDLKLPTTVGDVFLAGANAEGANDNGTRSTQVVYANKTSALLTLERVTLQATNGADGADGDAGDDAPADTPYIDGDEGGDGLGHQGICDVELRGVGGTGGTNPGCPTGAPTYGGNGGYGGSMDTCCDCLIVCVCLTCDCTATAGWTGSNAGQSLPGFYGSGGAGGAGSDVCGPGLPGKPGLVTNGAAGVKGSGGQLVDGFWYARTGGTGGVGNNGGGGGGGGGSGGCDDEADIIFDTAGAGGGGGGAGGCAALGGGEGGAGGGGSFGLLAISSKIKLTDCDIQLGNGGNAGDGGPGGRGQSGGAGGDGGIGDSGSANGGKGGDGGHGGHGGGGGGGAGGVAYGIFEYQSQVTQNCTFSGGKGGAGGEGGPSAPTAPIQDGNPGFDGDDAPPAANVTTCSNPGNC